MSYIVGGWLFLLGLGTLTAAWAILSVLYWRPRFSNRYGLVYVGIVIISIFQFGVYQAAEALVVIYFYTLLGIFLLAVFEGFVLLLIRKTRVFQLRLQLNVLPFVIPVLFGIRQGVEGLQCLVGIGLRPIFPHVRILTNTAQGLPADPYVGWWLWTMYGVFLTSQSLLILLFTWRGVFQRDNTV